MSFPDDKVFSEDDPHLKIRVFNDVLKDAHPSGDINLFTTATEIEAKLKGSEEFKKKLDLFLKTSDDLETALRRAIDDLNNMLLSPNLSPTTKMVYTDTSSGRDRPLLEYIGGIFDEHFAFLKLHNLEFPGIKASRVDPVFKLNALAGVVNISRGVAIKFIMQEWKKQLDKINRENPFDQDKLPELKPLPYKWPWRGTPAQLGFFIIELNGKGFADRPTRSYIKDAEFYLSIFEIDTTVENLANEINPKSNSLSPDNARILSITHKDKLKKGKKENP